jgi:hypothetical protein
MKNIAIGCGIVALVIGAIAIGTTIFGVRWVKQQLADAERYEHVRNEMRDEYGLPEDFTPPMDGQYDPARVDQFVSLREHILDEGQPVRAEIEEMAAGKSEGWFKGMRTLLTIINKGVGYIATADSLLLDAGMSHGEYAHYETIVVCGMLEEDVQDFLDQHPLPEEEDKFAEAFDDLARQYRRDARSLLESHARNAAQEARSAPSECETCPAWLDYLEDQLEQSRLDRRHVAFTDPLPESLAASFERHRVALEATRPTDYGTWILTMLMVMELDDDDGGFQVEIGN